MFEKSFSMTVDAKPARPSQPKPVRYHGRFSVTQAMQGIALCDAIANYATQYKWRVDPELIARAIACGAVFVKRKKQLRVYDATFPLQNKDGVLVHIDSHLLHQHVAKGQCVLDQSHYSVWYKPVGMVSQGSEWGDHLSLLRQVEQSVSPKRPVFLLHRLDRETHGLMLFAHDKATAQYFSSRFADDSSEHLHKDYLTIVKGELNAVQLQSLVQTGKLTQLADARYLIGFPLDGKTAETEFAVQQLQQGLSLVVVRLRTGRLHQIRRHFAELGFAVLGDPKYGKGNKHKAGLQLCAYHLQFRCPKTKQMCSVTLPQAQQLSLSALLPNDDGER